GQRGNHLSARGAGGQGRGAPPGGDLPLRNRLRTAEIVFRAAPPRGIDSEDAGGGSVKKGDQATNRISRRTLLKGAAAAATAPVLAACVGQQNTGAGGGASGSPAAASDRKSTRLNSSHEWISYAVFCLKKKKKI